MSSDDFLTGEPVQGAKCPSCAGTVVYNGNYFCLDCEWALPAEFEGYPIETDLCRALIAQLMYQRGDPAHLHPVNWLLVPITEFDW